MQLRYHNIHETRSYVAAIIGREIRVGSSRRSDVVLNSPFVSPEAAVLRRDSDRWILKVLNHDGCTLNGVKIPAGKSAAIRDNGTFQLFPFEFSLDPEDSTAATEDDVWNDLENRTLELVRQMHVELLEQMNLASVPVDDITEDYLLRIERNLEMIARNKGITETANIDLVLHLAGHCVRGELIDATLRFIEPEKASVFQQDSNWSRLHSGNPTRERELMWLQRNVGRVLNFVDLENTNQLTQRMKQIDTGFRAAWKQVASEVLEESLMYLCLRQLKKQIKDIVFGYGPLEDLLRLPTITEVMVVGSDRIFVERGGIIENSGRRFVSDTVTLAVIERIVSRVGRRIDKSQPVADARLSDGSRVNAVIAPLRWTGCCSPFVSSPRSESP
ncbi:MAG: ATPase, T2SS/T4P/T4SS family [Planctomycetaceae bacterium]